MAPDARQNEEAPKRRWPRRVALAVAAACLLLVVGTWALVSTDRWPFDESRQPARAVFRLNRVVGLWLVGDGGDSPAGTWLLAHSVPLSHRAPGSFHSYDEGGAAGTEAYTWTDKSGTVHFSARPEDVPAKARRRPDAGRGR